MNNGFGASQRKAYKRKTRTSKSQENWTYADWKKFAWSAFSRFIRRRDCIRTTGTWDHCLCVTCGKRYAFKKGLQAGHFMPGRSDAGLFDEYGVHGQCYRCNQQRSGETAKYYRFMQEQYGQEVIEDVIEALLIEDEKYTVPELQKICTRYAEKEKQLYADFHGKTYTPPMPPLPTG